MSHTFRMGPLNPAMQKSRAMRLTLAIGAVAMVLIGLGLLYLLMEATDNTEMNERNYARLLGINDDEVVARYNAGKPAHGRGEARFARRRDNWRGSAGAGRVGVVLALMAISVLVMFYNRQPPTVATTPS